MISLPSAASSVVDALEPPTNAKMKLFQLRGKCELIERNRATKAADLVKVQAYLSIAQDVGAALDKLSEQLFAQIAKLLEDNLTRALQEVLEQPIELRVIRDTKAGRETMAFHMERNGQPEDIMKGQGGSVVNILSVGLRMFGLTRLNSNVHRRFLVLDEQDCWIQPDLVPLFVKIVHDASRVLGFQVLMISHHDISAFQNYADKIYEFVPTADGVRVKERVVDPSTKDD